MRLKAVLCIPLGHKWEAAPEADTPHPLMRCKRCRRTTIFSDETRSKMTFAKRVKPFDDFGNPLP
jgi:hypothetical protein